MSQQQLSYIGHIKSQFYAHHNFFKYKIKERIYGKSKKKAAKTQSRIGKLLIMPNRIRTTQKEATYA